MEHVYCVNDIRSDQRDNTGETTIVPRPNTPEPPQNTTMDTSEATRVTIKEGNIQFQGSADVSDVCEKPPSKGDEVLANEIINGSTAEAELASDASVSQGINTPSELTEGTELPTTASSEEKPQGDTPAATEISNTPAPGDTSNTPAGDTSTSMAADIALVALSSDQSTRQVRALYDFDAQPGTGELSIKEGEILTVSRQDVGEGWWEGTNSQGQAGLFPAAYVEVHDSSAPPPNMPPPPLPTEYANLGNDWTDVRTSVDWSSQNNTFTGGQTQNAQNAQRQSLPQQLSYDNDEWDDDWDDDDSEPGSSYPNGPGNFGLSTANRSHKPVTSSVSDVSNAGAGKASVDEKDKVFVDDYGNGPVWRPNQHEFTCAISSPKKESKFHGMKSFIAYTLMPSFSSTAVSRRYKHFDWIQGRLSEKFPLIPIPPLPEKQISGRFEEDLIEYRMTMLQSWVDRICRHPILAQCEVFHHFVTCPNDEKVWKSGKRKAESDKLVGANFYLAIERPDTPLDLMQTEAKLEGYSRFFSNLDESVKLLQNTCIDQTKKHQTAFKREYNKISHSFSKLSRAFDTDPSNCAPGLTDAIHHVSEAYADIGTVFEEEPKHDWDPLCHLLFEYKGLIDGFPSVISAAKGAIAKRRQVEKEASEGRLDDDQVPPMVRRSDTIAYALHAEVAHFHNERQRDFKKAMTSFLTEQINFYQKITDRLRDSLQKFNDV
ncbi:sorting nexin lst-4-like isoform X2 [Scylla paramamosain]